MYTIKQRAYGMCVYLKHYAGLSHIAQVPETILIAIMIFDLNFKSKTFVSFSLRKINIQRRNLSSHPSYREPTFF